MSFQQFGRQGGEEPVDSQIIIVAANTAVIFFTGNGMWGVWRVLCTMAWAIILSFSRRRDTRALMRQPFF